MPIFNFQKLLQHLPKSQLKHNNFELNFHVILKDFFAPGFSQHQLEIMRTCY